MSSLILKHANKNRRGAFFLLAIEHNERLRFIGRPERETAMTRSDQHSDLGVGLLYLLGGASIVLLIFAWAVNYSIY